MKIRIKYPYKNPTPELTLSPDRFIELYGKELSLGQIRHIQDTYKECNILYDQYRLDVQIKKKGVWLDYTFIAPKGMVLNGSSVPNIGKALINEDYHNRAYKFHDLGYICKGRYNVVQKDVEVWLKNPELSRKELDKIFVEVIKLHGAPWWERWIAYAGMRFGGQKLWDKPYNENAFIFVEPK